MKLTILSDNHTIIDRYYLGEPAVCYYIECGGKKLLFDTGYSDVYVRNAEALGIGLGNLDTVVLSHGHNDHTGGLAVLPEQEKKPELVAHPLVFEPREHEGLNAGVPLTKEEAGKRFELRLSKEPVEVAPKLFFLGEIERGNDFENREPVGFRIHEGKKIPDFLPDDSALAYAGEEGLSIITGCSHSGICNIIEQAKRLTGETRIRSVLGGFHLMDPEAVQLERTAEYFAKMRGTDLYPCHCTCFAARARIHRQVPVKEVGSGTVFEWK